MPGPSPYTVRLARMSDLEQVVGLITAAAQWIQGIGLDQWQVEEDWRRRWVHLDIVAGTVWVVEDGAEVIGTITVDEWADADFWHPDEHVHDALYCHRMAVAQSHRGRGLGSAMLDWAAALATGADRSWVRFDAWSTNHALHTYYKGLGFEMVRNIPVEGRGSGALFERPATERGQVPQLCRRMSMPSARPLVSSGPRRVPRILRRRHRRRLLRLVRNAPTARARRSGVGLASGVRPGHLSRRGPSPTSRR